MENAPHGSITDVPGVRVGHAQRSDEGWLTGVTVVLPPPGTVGGVDVRGGGPGTHETDALDPRTLVPTVDAVVLTGGSAFGLVSAHGAQRWCAEHGRGFPVSDRPGEVVPIVPAAAVFDLGRGGVFGHHPDEQMGYDATAAAAATPEHAPVARGTVGAGTGAAIAAQRFKGGVGTASVRISGGPVVGAIAVVNAAGAPVVPGAPVPDLPPWATTELNTTLAVVATDAALDPSEVSRTATAAHDGLARALDPVHTLADGDTVFALATGRLELPSDRPARVTSLVALQAAAATAVRLAVLDGVTRATAVHTSRVDLPVWPHAPA
ncbi:P1 family peptidase [Actinotalea sp. M2MS4P-6]|uniref:P1 family peptidase n=1 Tax=Actinotalea sp. M2MS4P-6 TaxID=2983762 RepID=UPI0021E3F3BA|nr:P1 family peptidase [Actinotalea sp. M2MS4P-6]MCV2396290.1 P1 family peptidase [Actinotalea sp. M2MS4P-6]